MGICNCKLDDGTFCTRTTVWNDMCEDCIRKHEDKMWLIDEDEIVEKELSKIDKEFKMSELHFDEGERVTVDWNNIQGNGVIAGVSTIGMPIIGKTYIVKNIDCKIDKDVYPYSCFAVPEIGLNKRDVLKDSMSYFTEMLHYSCDFNDLEALIKKNLGFYYEIPCMEEQNNGSSITFCVDSKELSDYDKAPIEAMIKGAKVQQYKLRHIMNYMCWKGMIKEGEYLVDIWW